MQERKVAISRVIKSARVLPQTKETPVERIARFVDAQRQVVAYPFSPELSVKALGAPVKNSKDPSADNKAKRKKAESKLLRVGKAIFDPNAKPQKGQYFETRARAINQDGQLGDVPNIGWLDPIKTIAPENLVSNAKLTIANRRGVSVRKVPARKNPRTGAMEAKALGTSIGRIAGNIGQAAARAVGIVVDGDGKFRCPPGVPAANQFTDEVGSNCFDFSPLVARALVAIAQKFGHQTIQNLTKINNATPFERDVDYRLVRQASTRNIDFERISMLGASMSLRSGGSLLGPDGKPIPRAPEPTVTRIEPFDLTERELDEAASDLAVMARGTGKIVDPATYEDEFEKALRAAYPDLSPAEIKKMAKLAADRERMKDKMRQEQRDAIDVIRSLGIDVDENDPASVQRGLALALHKMKEMGWDIDLDSYFGKGFADNPEIGLLAHKQRLAELARIGVIDGVNRGIIHGLGPDDIQALEKKYGKTFIETLKNAIADGANPSEVFPDDDKAQTLLAIMQNSMSKARQYETGLFMSLVNARNKTPHLTDDIKMIALADASTNDIFFAEMGIKRDGSGLFLGINIHGMLLTHPAVSVKDSDNFLYEPVGTAGTEIEKLKRIGEVVSSENREKLLGSYFDDLRSFGSRIDQIKRGEGYMTETMNSSFGGIALGQFVGIHELTHGRQLILAKEVIHSRNPSMTNEEAFKLAWQMILGRTLRTPDGQDFDYGTMMADPNILRTAISNMSDIVGILTGNQVGGVYGVSHYYGTFYLNEALRQSNSISDLVGMYQALEQRKEELDPDSAEYIGLEKALNDIAEVLKTFENDEDALFAMKKKVNQMAQVTYMEMQADLNAAVKVGLIEETPEIKAFLAPLSLDLDLPDLRRNIVPPGPPPPPPTRKEKIRRLARAAKRGKAQTMADLREIVENALDDALNGISSDDRGLMSAGLGSAARFDSRGAASRWGKQVRDAALIDATDRQIEIIEEAAWRLMHDIKTPISRDGLIPEQKMRHRLLMGGVGDQWMADGMENDFIPFVEIVGDSKLPNSVAAEIVVPNEIIGFPGEDTKGRKFEINTHFTGVIKDNDSLGSDGGLANDQDGQRLIVSVPEGYSGLPDYTPGTSKSEVGSLILPPGEIEVVGVREDGVAIGRVISQRSIDDIIDAKRQELKKFDEKLTNTGDKITVRKAINRLERRQQVRSVAALRSSGATNTSPPDADTTKIPTDRSPKTRDIIERLKARGIKFGKSDKKTREEKRNQRRAKLKEKNTGTASVKSDSHEFESPEEASARVSREIDRAVGLIREGKLPGLAPEVAEIMKEKSPEEIRQMLVESAREFVTGLDKRPRFRIRGTRVRDVNDAREIPLLGFLKTGVYKTTYDADATGVAAASDAAKRSEYEVMLGIPEDLDSSLRPAHGFFTHKDQIEFEDDWKKSQLDEAEKRAPNAVSFRDASVLPPPSGSNNKLKDSDGNLRSVDGLPHQYGDSEIVLRTDAAGRSVGTMGDSLNGMRTPFELDGSSTDEELLESFVLNRGTAFEQSGGGNAVSPNSQRRIANLLNAHVGKNHAHTTDWTEDGGVPQREYVEAVVAGSFDMSDVEEIRISQEFQDTNTKMSSIKANEVDESHVRELLSDVLPSDDIDSAVKLISEPQSDAKAKSTATALRELVSARLSLVRERAARRNIRGQVVQRSSEGRAPKVTFLNRDGINIDDPRTFKRTMDAMGMTEEHEIDDIVKYGTARAVREQLSSAGIATSPESSFAAMKPKATLEPQVGLRSSGATRSREDLLRELLVPAYAPGQEPIGSRSLQMMDEARNRREELSRILDAARAVDNYFEQYELQKVLDMADKPFAHLDDEILDTLKQIKERPGLSESAKKKIDRKLARLERSRKESALMERIEPVRPSIYRSGADASRRLARRADSSGRRLDVADPAKRSQILDDLRRSRISAEGRRNTTEIAQREILGGNGSRSSFRTRGVGASLRSSGASSGSRNTDAKISEGPQILPSGRDSQNLPRVLSSSELEEKFGNSAKQHRKYFKRYGIKVTGKLPTDPVEKDAYYASLQALDDLFQNVNHKKLMKGQKLIVEINPTFMMSLESGVLGEFNRSRRIFFSFGPNKANLRINTAGLSTKANELFQRAQGYKIVDGLEKQVLSDFVSRLYINRDALTAPDAENEISRRLSYASMIHELGHFLDYAATKDEDRVRWRSAISGMIRPQDVETEEFKRGSYLSYSMRDELDRMPSVSRYGASNPQEKVAEGFTAWWLFSKRPDIKIMADSALSDKEPERPVSSTMGETSARIVRGLLEELGPRVKSAKKPTRDSGSDDLPPLVTLYTMLPFMIVDGESA